MIIIDIYMKDEVKIHTHKPGSQVSLTKEKRQLTHAQQHPVRDGWRRTWIQNRSRAELRQSTPQPTAAKHHRSDGAR